MSTSNKPIIWSLFAAGGTVTALLTPVLILLFALAEFQRIRAMLS